MAEHEFDLAAFALGLLEGDERAAIEQHMRTCDQCAAELRDYQRVTDMLPQALATESPPNTAWDNIAARVRAARPATAGQGGWFRSLLARPLVPSLVAVLLLAVIALGAWNGVLQYRLANDSESGGALTVYLRSLDAGSDASGQLRMTPDRQLGGLVVHDLPQLATGDSYVVWFVRPDQTRERVGAFPVDQLGQAVVELDVPQPLDQFDGVGISLESGDVASPTRVDLLAGIIYDE